MTFATWHCGKTPDWAAIHRAASGECDAGAAVEKYRTGAQDGLGEVKGLKGRAGALLSLLHHLGRQDHQLACTPSGCPGQGIFRR